MAPRKHVLDSAGHTRLPPANIIIYPTYLQLKIQAGCGVCEMFGVSMELAVSSRWGCLLFQAARGEGVYPIFMHGRRLVTRVEWRELVQDD